MCVAHISGSVGVQVQLKLDVRTRQGHESYGCLWLIGCGGDIHLDRETEAACRRTKPPAMTGSDGVNSYTATHRAEIERRPAYQLGPVRA